MKALVAVLAVIALMSGCGADDTDRPSSETCARPGHPVTVARLVEIFQSNDLSLEVNQSSCGLPGSARPDATNFGPAGLKRDPDVSREEGDILCYLGTAEDPAEGEDVGREHFEGEEETALHVLNVNCVVYPSDEASAERQIAKVEQTLRALVHEP